MAEIPALYRASPSRLEDSAEAGSSFAAVFPVDTNSEQLWKAISKYMEIN